MRKKDKKLEILLIIFIFLWIIFSALCWYSFTNIKKIKKSIKRQDKTLKRLKNYIAENSERMKKLSNLVGFHVPLERGGELYSNIDSIVYFLDNICSEDKNVPCNKNILGLNLNTQKLDPNNSFIKNESVNREKFLQVDVVKSLINLEDVWNACATRIEELQKEIKDIKNEIQNSLKEYKRMWKESEDEISNLNKEIKNKRESIKRLRYKKSQELIKKEEERKKEREAKLRLKDKIAELLRTRRLQKSKYESELENLEERIKELKAEAKGERGIEKWFKIVEKKRKEEVQQLPDGEIIYVDNINKIAYIDLGMPDGVLKGMTFKIFRYGKGGKKIYKGKIIIRKVEENISKVGITEITNPLDPIRVGDKIINPVYDKNKVKYFAIAGKLTQKYSLEQVKRLVRKIGGRIEQQITPKTDIVVLGEGFRNDPLYKIAVEQGIETMLESEFLEYIISED